MLTCKEVSRLLSRSMDQPLPRLQRLELRLHVWMCAACSNFERQLLFLRRAARQMDQGEVQTNEAGLSSEARERIRKAVRQ